MKLAIVEVISALVKHDNADSLEVATIQGWQSIVKAGQFKVGQTVIFIPIDTVLTPFEWNSFLHNKKDPAQPIRVKTVRLRGKVSQGLVFPLSIINLSTTLDSPMFGVGDDVAELIGVTKYEKPLSSQLAGKVKGNFPSHIVKKTDEDNLMSQIKLLDELKESGQGAVATLKWDGSSLTVIREESDKYLPTRIKFSVCSRNLELIETEGNTFWSVVRKYDLENGLSRLCFEQGHSDADGTEGGIAIQGELVGPAVNGNQPALTQHEFRLFNAKWLDSGTECGYSHLQSIASYLGVPLAESVKIWSAEEVQALTLQELQDLANLVTYPSGTIGEGIVVRPLTPVFSKRLQKSLSFKIINQNYND